MGPARSESSIMWGGRGESGDRTVRVYSSIKEEDGQSAIHVELEKGDCILQAVDK